MKLKDAYQHILNEKLKTKNRWTEVKPDQYWEDLIKLVQKAYAKTDMGPFVNSKADAMDSKWKAIDLAKDDDINATVFYRTPRSNEPWGNRKVRGIGHDNSREAIDKILKKLKEMLKSGSFWIEASGALEHLLYKMNVPYVQDEETVKKVFPNREVKMIDKGKHQRSLESGKTVKETIFGNPGV